LELWILVPLDAAMNYETAN